MTTEERFWSKVAFPVLPQGEFLPDDCWVWKHGTNEHGYGMFWMPETRQMEKAHRVSWVLAHEPITSEQKVLHSCDNPPCVNPSHLRIGTQAENHADAVARGRHSPPPHYMGERNPAARLTANEVAQARADWHAGQSAASLARRYGVSATTMKDALKGRTWPGVMA